MQHECLGEGRYRSKYEIFLVEIIPTGVHKSFKKCTLTQTQYSNESQLRASVEQLYILTGLRSG